MQIAGRQFGGEFALGSIEDALNHPEHVCSAENDADGGGDGPSVAYAGEGTGEDEELSDEAVQHGQTEHGERDDDEEGSQARYAIGEAAVCGDLARCVADLESTEEHEERSVDDLVVEDLIGCAGPACEGESIDPDSDESEVAERGERE